MRLPIINWLTAFSSIHSSFSFPKQMRELCWFGHTPCVKSSMCWFWKESGDAFLWKFYPSTSNILQLEVTSEETYLQMPTWLPYMLNRQIWQIWRGVRWRMRSFPFPTHSAVTSQVFEVQSSKNWSTAIFFLLSCDQSNVARWLGGFKNIKLCSVHFFCQSGTECCEYLDFLNIFQHRSFLFPAQSSATSQHHL